MTPNNINRPRRSLQALIFLLISILLVIGIIYMKHTSASPIPQGSGDTDLLNLQHPVAVPDTTTAPGILPATADSVAPSVLPDTVLGRDKRPAYEAGYEDGYAAGCDDGAAQAKRDTYDESNSFSSKSDKDSYVRGYREGYEKGYTDGTHGKQFNI